MTFKQLAGSCVNMVLAACLLTSCSSGVKPEQLFFADRLFEIAELNQQLDQMNAILSQCNSRQDSAYCKTLERNFQQVIETTWVKAGNVQLGPCVHCHPVALCCPEMLIAFRQSDYEMKAKPKSSEGDYTTVSSKPFQFEKGSYHCIAPSQFKEAQSMVLTSLNGKGDIGFDLLPNDKGGFDIRNIHFRN
ncbi:MAG: hypothetical protein D6730_19865 [Bacteroidetes bacterium]|nr:MAG: hypothetical protein D6730_19865 [Bacteroidota bacterium]